MPDSFTFRAMTYNLHLFGGSVAGFETFNDDQRLTEIIRAIRAESPPPDVIGLTEVWDCRFAERLENELGDLYPYIAVGSFESNVGVAVTTILLGGLFIPAALWLGLIDAGAVNAIGSGLVLMSRYPFDGDPVFHPYISEAGVFESFDAWAEKGVLAVKIQVPDISATVGVLLTHLEADSDKADVRRDQLRELASVAAHLRLSSPSMALLAMGDFNVIGEDSNSQQTAEYRCMIKQLGLDDTWRAQNPSDLGVTSDGKSNDLIKQFDEDNVSQKRLDYIFYEPNPSYYVDCKPTLCELLKYRSAEGIGDENVRDLSDHYGLIAEYHVAIRPFGTITYHVDPDTTDMTDIETPALRSLLAWMEKAAIGYAQADPAEEAPIIRVGFADADLPNGAPVIEWLGRVLLNPRPLLNGAPWRWGLGCDPQARQLDLAYALQHFIGLALHSVSPRADSVKTPLDEQVSTPKSVMLPYQPDRELADGNGQPDPDHLNHLTNSDIDYITALYGKRTEHLEWQNKVRALQSNDLIKTILESGLIGTNGPIAQNIVRIDKQIAKVQARIPINASVYINELVWCGGINDRGIWEDEEIRFTLTADDGTGGKKEYFYPSRDGEYEISCENPIPVPVYWNPLQINGITSNFSLTLEVTELDSGLNGCNKYHRQHIKLADHGLNEAIKDLRSLSDHSFFPTKAIQPLRIDCPGKWWAEVAVVLYSGSVSEVGLLRTQRTKEQGTLNRLRSSFGRDLVASVSNQLGQIWGGSS